MVSFAYAQLIYKSIKNIHYHLLKGGRSAFFRGFSAEKEGLQKIWSLNDNPVKPTPRRKKVMLVLYLLPTLQAEKAWQRDIQ